MACTTLAVFTTRALSLGSVFPICTALSKRGVRCRVLAAPDSRQVRYPEVLSLRRGNRMGKGWLLVSLLLKVTMIFGLFLL